MRRLILAAAFFAGASSATAQTEAPPYYVESLFAVTMAEQLAAFCSAVSFDLTAGTDFANSILGRLESDGIEGDDVLRLTGIEDAVGVLQTAFSERYDLASPTEEKLCAAALSEMTEGSALGDLLIPAEGN